MTGIDYENFPPPGRVEFFYRDQTTGILFPIRDRAELGGAARNEVVDFFLGGLLQSDDERMTYSPAFTIHLQRMLRDEVPREIYLRVYPTFFNSPILPQPGRALINGPAAGDGAARVRVTFTDVN